MLESLKRRLNQNNEISEARIYEAFNKILMKYRKIYLREIFIEDYVLKINLSDNNDFEMFKELNDNRYPILKCISLGFINRTKFYEVRKFLKKSFPNSLNCLELNCSKRPTEVWDLADLSDYIDFLVNVSDLIDDEIRVYNFTISAATLSKLIVRFCHWNKISICWSKFDFSDSNEKLDFWMSEEPELQKVNFEGWGDPVLNDWKNNPESLIKILNAFKRSDIRDSIKKFSFDEWNLEDTQIADILTSCKFENMLNQ